MQFTCPYSAQGFPPGTLTKPAGDLSFTSDRLAHALFTTGRAPGDQARHGASSVYEWLHRVAIIPAYLRAAGGGSLTRSPLAVELDRSEKVGLSYALGQAMTSLFCTKYLGVQFFMHVDRYHRRHNMTFRPGTRQRPDLFGFVGVGAGRRWVVAEAKGRSNLMEFDLPLKMSSQKQSVRTIRGSRPWVTLGCVASFPPPSRTLQVDAFDPEEVETEAIDIDADPDHFLLAYYEPFVAALDVGQQDPESDDRVQWARFQGVRVRVGLLSTIAEAVRLATRAGAERLSAETVLAALRASATSPAELSDRPGAAFADGSFVEGDWDEALSLRSES